MESADFHDQELQDHVVGSSSSSPFCYYNDWTPNSILNSNGVKSYPKETFLMNPRQQQKIDHNYMSSLAPETSDLHRFEQDLQLNSRIKEEMSYNYYLKYTEILNSFPSDNLTNNGNIGLSWHMNPPSISSSNSNREGITLANPGSLEMNLQPLDHLQLPYSSRFDEYFSQNRIGITRDGFSYNLGHSHQSCVDLKPRLNSNKISEAEAKRSTSEMEPDALHNAQKKSRFEARASCPPFKVRKEKLGDRVAALQQLVAPFGKTDTASVLMEAIGYIKFLQTQVETLSVPYMKTSPSLRIIKTVNGENKNEEPQRDLKSRGLCLVPLSCLSYIADGGGAAVWPPPHFGGAA